MFFSRDLLDVEQIAYSARLRETLTNIYSTIVLHEVREGEHSVREVTNSPVIQLKVGG